MNIFEAVGEPRRLGDDVPPEELEGGSEHVVTEPNFTECVEQTFVVVVRHSAAILDLPEHVAHAAPIYALS